MGWPTVTLGEICEFQGGSQPPKSQFISEPADGYVRLLQIRDFKSDSKAIYIPESTKNRICSSDDIMLARYGASVGQIHRGKGGAYNVALIKTVPNTELLDKDFFYLYLLSEDFQKPLFSVAERSAQAGFSKADISPFQIPLPPIPEQQRIVAILDKAFADIEKARANAEKNLKNARELFDSYLNQVFSQRGEGWVDKTILEITSLLGDGLHGTPKYEEDGDYYFINGNNLNDGNIQLKSKTKRVSFDEFKKYKKNLNDRTVLVSINGTLGNVAFYDNEKVVLGKSACYFNLLPGISKQYIKYVIESPLFQNYAETVATGATIKNVSLKSMRAFSVPIAPENDQEKMVGKLEILKEKSIKIECMYVKKLASLDELKKSLLQKAFSGELTKTEGHAA
jgi:type I restriction enzyme S subunit